MLPGGLLRARLLVEYGLSRQRIKDLTEAGKLLHVGGVSVVSLNTWSSHIYTGFGPGVFTRPYSQTQFEWPDKPGRPFRLFMSGDYVNHAMVIDYDSSFKQIGKREISPSNEVRSGQPYELQMSMFSNDGKTLAAVWNRSDEEATSDGTVDLMDGTTGRLLRHCAGPFHLPAQQYDGSMIELTFSADDDLGRIPLLRCLYRHTIGSR